MKNQKNILFVISLLLWWLLLCFSETATAHANSTRTHLNYAEATEELCPETKTESVAWLGNTGFPGRLAAPCESYLLLHLYPVGFFTVSFSLQHCKTRSTEQGFATQVNLLRILPNAP